MTEATATDLKNFIAGALHQQSFELRQEINELGKQLQKEIDRLDTKIDSLATVVFDALDTYHKDHEDRITKLEARKV